MNYLSIFMRPKIFITFFFHLVLLGNISSANIDSLLTKEEKEWLDKNKNKITFSSDPFLAPIDFVGKNDVPMGIVADYVKIFEEKLNTKFTFKSYNTWSEVLSALKRSEVGFVGSVDQTHERSHQLLFTKPYLELPVMILVREDYPPITSKEQISEMTLSVVVDYSSINFIEKNYPGADIKKFDSDLSALLQTSFGHTDGTIIDLASASYLIGKYKINNLVVGSELDYSWNLSFASSKENPILISIIGKLLQSIDDKQKSEIYEKWIHINNYKSNFLRRYKSLIIGASIILLIIIVSIITYNRKLKKQVDLKTRDLKKEVDEKNRALQLAKESEENYQQLFDYGALPKWIYDIETYRILRVNQTAIEHYGYSEEEFLNMTIMDLRTEEEISKLLNANRGSTRIGDTYSYGIWKHIKKNREVIDVEVFGYVIIYKGRRCKSISCFDVTQRLKDEQMLKDFAENLERKVEIRTEELFDAHRVLKEQHQEITDSIDYAKKIQHAIFPKIKEFKKIFNPSFIFFRPKDVVSGDFYWCEQIGNSRFAVVGDCTGHGVPGALLTMIGNQLLKQTIILKKTLNPAKILEEMNSEINRLMGSGSNSTKDGMDIAICRIDDSRYELVYAGARISLFYAGKNGLEEIKGSKNSVGGGILNTDMGDYSNHVVKIKKGDSIYLSTDGFFDQFGGANDKKLSKRRFMELLNGIKHLPIRVQCSKTVGFFKKWKASREQTDDVLMVGIEL